MVEPRYPAAVDRYVNLGRFYDVDALKKRRLEVVTHTEAYKEAYQRAFHCLKAARQVERSAFSRMAQGLGPAPPGPADQRDHRPGPAEKGG